MKRMILLSLIAMQLSSCGIYTHYERPDNIRTDSLYGNIQGDTVSIASLSWREVFTDPELQSLIEEGLEHNTDLRIAYLKTEEAQAALTSARLAFLPSLSLTPQG